MVKQDTIMKQNLIMGFPLYHQVPATFFAQWLQMERGPVMGAVVVNGSYITTAMGMIVENALNHKDWERLVILEHDMIPPLDAFEKISRYSPEQAVVGSMYFNHEAPFNAMVYVEDSTGFPEPISSQTVKEWCDKPALYPCDGLGFGLTSIARHVLEDWDPNVPMFGMDKQFGSHDLWFCHYASQQGYKVYVDSGIVCDHLTEVPIGLSQNQQAAQVILNDEI
jgi:hypothetical protein